MIWESREWLVARDWELVDFKMEEAIGTLMDFWHKVKPNYTEGELVRTVDLFWRQNNYDSSITKMDHLIDKMPARS